MKVELLSYPRSGSTWLRKMIWHATGIASAPRVPDPPEIAKAMGLPFTEPTDPVLIKSHTVDETDFDRRILLWRKPADCIASYARMHDAFEILRVPDAWFARNHAQEWEIFHRKALKQNHRTLVIRYEDLLAIPELVLAKVIGFILPVVKPGTITISNAIAKASDMGDPRFYFNGSEGTAVMVFDEAVIRLIARATAQCRRDLEDRTAQYPAVIA